MENKWDQKRQYLKRIHEAFSGLFKPLLPCTFHNLLWQIMINESMKNRRVAFSIADGEHGWQLVIADAAGGYFPTGVFFKSPNFKHLCTVTDIISSLVFDITTSEALDRVRESITKDCRGK